MRFQLRHWAWMHSPIARRVYCAFPSSLAIRLLQAPYTRAVIVPRRNLLKSPKDGARLRTAPKLTWALDSEAAYYNAQLLLNGQKILSVWPTKPAFAVKKSWKFEGRKYTLKPGVYTWFVWPGYGARSAVDYGELMGSRTFRIVR